MGLKKIHNYYGLVEQTGSIFFDCEKCGCFITSIFSEVIIRDNNFKVAKDGESGIIQLLSVLPTSYPGHNILTEDEGKIVNSINVYVRLKVKDLLYLEEIKSLKLEVVATHERFLQNRKIY